MVTYDNLNMLGDTMNRSVYFRDGVFLRIQEMAKERGLSVNGYINAVADPHGVLHPLEKGGQLDRIEKKLDLLIPKGMPEGLIGGKTAKEMIEGGFSWGPKNQDESEILAAAQSKLDEKRKGRDIKKEKIAKVKSFSFNPQPKAKWKK